MKIGELNQHCGDCRLIEYCGNPYCYCLCSDDRLNDIDEGEYVKIADKCQTKPHGECEGCKCDDCESCIIDDEARDYYCEQIADFVVKELKII